jgi:DNA-binding response OmpR family regulator
MKVLLIDDDRELVEVLVFAFRRAGLVTSAAHDVASGLARFEQDQPDLVVLDLHLGSSNGFDFLRQVRERSQVPIIILTALAGEDDKVKGLSLGADDYVTKPFSHRELLTRIQMRLRRPGQAGPTKSVPDVLHVGDIELDASAHTVQRAGRPVNLTVTEFRLLHHLLVNAGQVVRTEDILRHVWGNPDPTDSDVLRVTLHRLRRKLGETGSANGNLRTVPGVGVLMQGERVIAPDVPPSDEDAAVPTETVSAASQPVAPAASQPVAPAASQPVVPAASPPVVRAAVPPSAAPYREPAPAPAVVPDRGGRIERDGQERMRLRFRPDAEIESVLFVTPAATLESYDPATDEVTWTMPARGERAWDVFDVARKRGFSFADDIAVPTPMPQEAATAPATAPPEVEAPVPEPPTLTALPQGNGRQPLAVTVRAGAERAANRLERVASAAAAGARSRTIQPAVTTPQLGRPVVAKIPKATTPATGNLRKRFAELGLRMSGSGRTAAMFLGVAMITAAVSILAESARLRLLSELERVGEISAATYQQTEARQFILAFALLVLYVFSAVAFLVWIQRSYARLAARPISGLRYNQITAVIWFLVPVAFLFVPRRVVTELWYANPLASGARVARRLRVPMLVSVWWTAFVAFAISAALTGATTPEPTITDLFRQTWTNVASDLLAIVAGGLAIAVISAIELRQPQV